MSKPSVKSMKSAASTGQRIADIAKRKRKELRAEAAEMRREAAEERRRESKMRQNDAKAAAPGQAREWRQKLELEAKWQGKTKVKVELDRVLVRMEIRAGEKWVVQASAKADAKALPWQVCLIHEVRKILGAQGIAVTLCKKMEWQYGGEHIDVGLYNSDWVENRNIRLHFVRFHVTIFVA